MIEAKTLSGHVIKTTEYRDDIHMMIVNNVRLNRFDSKFMINMSANYISQDKPLSPGQNELYEKLIHKYRKQFKKMSVSYKDIIMLPWKNGIVSEKILLQQTYLNITASDVIEMAFNFNKKHIDTLREFIHDDAGNYLKKGTDSFNFGGSKGYDFIWHKDVKKWIGKFNVYLFRSLVDFAANSKIQQSINASLLIRDINKLGSEKDWTPSIHVSNNRLYISMITETMLPYIKDIDFTNVSLPNVERLVKLGLEVPAQFGDISLYANPQTSDHHHLKDLEDVAILKAYLMLSGRKAVLYAPDTTWSKDKYVESLNKLQIKTDDNLLVVTNGLDFAAVDELIEDKYNTFITVATADEIFRTQKDIGRLALAASKIIHIKL